MVLVRSYSRHSWVIRCETDTDACGSTSATSSAARRSCSGLRNENRNEIATDSTPASPSRRAASRTAASSSGDQHLTARGHALAHLEAAAAGDQRGGPPIQDVVHAQEVAAPDLEHVPEPLGGDEAGQRALALEQGVDPDGGAVDDEAAVGQARARLVHAAEDALEQVVRGREGLRVHHRPGRLVERDQVREGAADVDADPESHGCAEYTGVRPRVASGSSRGRVVLR